MKFELHNLNYDGASAPSGPKAIRDTINDYVNTCRAKGFDIPAPPTEPILFTALIEDLTRLGLLGEASEGSGDQGPLLGDEAGPLSAVHRKNVII